MWGDDQARDTGFEQRVAVDRRLHAQYVGGSAAQVATAQRIGQGLLIDADSGNAERITAAYAGQNGVGPTADRQPRQRRGR